MSRGGRCEKCGMGSPKYPYKGLHECKECGHITLYKYSMYNRLQFSEYSQEELRAKLNQYKAEAQSK